MAGVHDPGDHRARHSACEGDAHDGGGVMSRWTAHLASEESVAISQRFPPVFPDCVGCEPDNLAAATFVMVRARHVVANTEPTCTTP